MLPLDQLMIEFTTTVDLKLQDEQLTSLTKINEQIEKCANQDTLLKNVLAVICLNIDVKADLVQFLRLLMKQKSGQENCNVFRNKVINSLTCILRVAVHKD